jgi:hypothetical protein
MAFRKTTTEMGRQHEEGLLVAAEYKRMEETSTGWIVMSGGDVLRGQGKMRAVVPWNSNKKSFT